MPSPKHHLWVIWRATTAGEKVALILWVVMIALGCVAPFVINVRGMMITWLLIPAYSGIVLWSLRQRRGDGL